MNMHNESGLWPLYVLHPGYVTSRSDGRRHYISAPRLAELYGVDIKACVILGSDVERAAIRPELIGDAIHLYPRSNGNYMLKAEGEE